MSKQTDDSSVLLIGITGVFGSGKSAVGKILNKFSVEVIDTDDIVREILSSKNEITDKVVLKFGNTVLSTDTGEYINKKALASIVFNDMSKKTELEEIIHPAVALVLKEQILLNKTKASIITVLVPLLFEANMQNFFNEIWCVMCDEDIKSKRLLEKGFSLDDIKARTRSQLSEVEKAKKANFIINNSKSVLETETQVLSRLKQLAQLNHNLHPSFDR